MKKKDSINFSRGAMRHPSETVETVLCGVIFFPSRDLALLHLTLETPGFSLDLMPVAPPELSPRKNAYQPSSQPYNPGPASIMKVFRSPSEREKNN